jgi:hypothetical protein
MRFTAISLLLARFGILGAFRGMIGKNENTEKKDLFFLYFLITFQKCDRDCDQNSG